MKNALLREWVNDQFLLRVFLNLIFFHSVSNCMLFNTKERSSGIQLLFSILCLSCFVPYFLVIDEVTIIWYTLYIESDWHEGNVAVVLVVLDESCPACSWYCRYCILACMQYCSTSACSIVFCTTTRLQSAVVLLQNCAIRIIFIVLIWSCDPITAAIVTTSSASANCSL